MRRLRHLCEGRRARLVEAVRRELDVLLEVNVAGTRPWRDHEWSRMAIQAGHDTRRCPLSLLSADASRLHSRQVSLGRRHRAA
jgi:hypothetical protein